MKIIIALLLLLGLVAAGPYPIKETKYADKEFLSKQKFLFEIVYRVEDPLFFEEYIKLGKSFVYHKDDYNLPKSHNDFMEKYYKAYKCGVTLPKGEYFAATVEPHLEQLSGLFDFFYYAKTWEIFQRNVCWARLHANEALFVHALSLAVMHRPDFEYLTLPAIYEIFPQYFFNSKFIYEAEKFDYNVWSKYIMYEKDYKDIIYADNAKYFKQYQNYEYFYTKDWKIWQWWKLMGLGEHWYSEDHFIMRDNVHELIKDSKYFEMMKDVKKFWMPVDYSRDQYLFNKESELSYFTEDVEWNAFWYYLNLDYFPCLKGADFNMVENRRGEYFFYYLRTMIARYYVERLSNGFGEIPEFSFFTELESGYDPQLIHYNGVGFSYRKNYFDYKTYGNFDYFDRVMDFFQRLENIVTQGYYTTAEGHKINLHDPKAIEYIGNMAHGNIDTYDKYFFSFWYSYAHMYFGEASENFDHIVPHVFLNYETMLRDPLFYQFYKKVTNVFQQFYKYVKPYSQRDLLFPGVEIEKVVIRDLVTYFDLVDFDVTNLLNDKPLFVDGEFVWNKSLFGRQMRLNHKDFDIEYIIKSDKDQKVVVRAFYGPKYDEYGKIIPLNKNRENFLVFDEFYYELMSGTNAFKRSSKDFFYSKDDHTTYTETYKYVMLAYEGKYDYPLTHDQSFCAYPDRLVLPRGWKEGLPMQLLFFVHPFNASYELSHEHDFAYHCGNIRGLNNVDDMPFSYPLDREIDEFEFFVRNMYLKDVKVYHQDTFEKYHDYKYEKFGSFDYSYFYNF